MKIALWLRAIDARLQVRMEMVLDPVTESTLLHWTCTITDFRETTTTRPATFLNDARGLDITGQGCGLTLHNAWERAVYSLQGHVLKVVGQGRDETHGIPQDLCP